jgi:hypothetical protein
VVRYQWAGGDNHRERATVTEAIARCFGVGTLRAEQMIEHPEGNLGPLADRIRYVFWLLRIFELSLGFTYGLGSEIGKGGAPREVCRITIRVDRSRYREEYDEF